MHNKTRFLVIISFDIFLIFLSQILAYSIRYEKIIFIDLNQYISLIYLFFFIISYILIFSFFRFKDISHRFFTIDQSKTLFKGMFILGVLWILFPIFLPQINYPRSIGALSFLNFLFLFYLSRYLINKFLNFRLNYKKKNIIFIGFNYNLYDLILGFANKNNIKSILVDKHSKLFNKNILGVKLQSLDNLFKILDNHIIDEIIIDKELLNHKIVKDLFQDLKKYNLKILTMNSNNKSVDNIQQVELNDIIFRGITDLNFTSSFDKDDVILVTGGSGSIGSSIIKEILKNFKDTKIISLDLSEYQTYLINEELKSKNLQFVIGNINDRKLIESILKKYKVTIIFHAAAYKHVPFMEENIYQSFQNNCIGTQNLVNISLENNIKKFILISSDKAVRPTNVMGLSKRLSEAIIDYHQQKYLNNEVSTLFCTVRFGNVLESSGSLIPLLRKQIKSGGPITITHPEVTRYFMTLSEAAHLVIESSFLTKGSDIFLFEMGKPMKILDLAKRMINLYGHQVKSDNDNGIDIKMIGLRPGEKMYEELLVNDKSKSTNNPNIFISDEERIDEKNYQKYINFINSLDISLKKELLIKIFSDEYSKYNFK